MFRTMVLAIVVKVQQHAYKKLQDHHTRAAIIHEIFITIHKSPDFSPHGDVRFSAAYSM